MNRRFAFALCVIIPMFSLESCGEADIPYMWREISEDFDITSPYQDVAGNYYDVNPQGIRIVSTKQLSDGTTMVTLGGGAVTNGISKGLHAINTATDLTDYPVRDQTSGMPITGAYAPGAAGTLEDLIALGPVAYNSKYTAITISGMIQHKDYVQIIERNNSLRLLTQKYYEGYNSNSALFNPKSSPMTKNMVYYRDPNLFSEGGYNPQGLTNPRGMREQNGGFNVLIWDGASPKQAEYSVSYDDGKTFRKTIVDWSRVNFAEIPLTNFVWEAANRNITVNASYKPIALTTQPVSNGVYKYIGTTTLTQLWQTGAYIQSNSIAEDLRPVFTPWNATNRFFWIVSPMDQLNPSQDDPALLWDPTMPEASLPGKGPYVNDKNKVSQTIMNAVTVELADRVRVSMVEGFPGAQTLIDAGIIPATAPHITAWICAYLPPVPTSSLPARLAVLELRITLPL